MSAAIQPIDLSSSTVLAGAGASVDAGVPPALPILDCIVQSVVAPSWACDALISRARRLQPDQAFLRFETLVLWIDDMFDESLGCFEFLDLYRDPGPTHDSLAAAAADGMRLLTVNFDDLFERAIDRIGLIPRTVDADRQDGVEWSNGTHVPVVRLHGTRRSHIDGTVHPSRYSVQATTVGIAATSPGTQLSDRAIGTFQEAVNHRTLVVLGYSASDDLDVVPTLQQADPAKLIWLEYEESSPRKVSAPREPGASAVVGIVKDRGIEVQVIRGRTSESLRLLGFPAGFKPPRIRVNWTHSIRNWANRHRWKDPTGLGFAGLVLGDIGAHDLALRAFRESKPSARPGGTWTRGRRSYEIGQTYYLSDGADLRSARRWAERALNEAVADGDDSIAVFSLLLLGRAAFLEQDYATARKQFRLVLDSGSALAKRHESFARSWLGRAELWDGRPASALPLLEQAHAVFVEEGDLEGIVDARHAIGLARRDLGDTSAWEDFHEAAKLASALGWREREMTAMCELGRTHYARGELAKAEATLREAARIATGSDEIADVYHAIGRLRLQQDRGRSALWHLHSARRTTTVVNRFALTEVWADIAAAHVSLQQPAAVSRALHCSRAEPDEHASWWGRSHTELVAYVAAHLWPENNFGALSIPPPPKGRSLTEAGIAVARLGRAAGTDAIGTLGESDRRNLEAALRS